MPVDDDGKVDFRLTEETINSLKEANQYKTIPSYIEVTLMSTGSTVNKNIKVYINSYKPTLMTLERQKLLKKDEFEKIFCDHELTEIQIYCRKKIDHDYILNVEQQNIL